MLSSRCNLRLPAFVLGILMSCRALAGAALPPGSADWELAREDDGITVETTPLSGSDYSAFRAVTTFDASVSEIMAVMIRPESCMEWVHNCIQARTIGKGEFADRYAYSVNNMPWPVTDRDYVLHLTTRGNPETGVVTMRMSTVTGKKPKHDDRVRVEKSDTLYRFIPITENRTRMIWVQHTEPNGVIPSWLVNTLLVDIPVKSLKALRQVIKEPRHDDHKLVYENGKLVDVVQIVEDHQDDGG